MRPLALLVPLLALAAACGPAYLPPGEDDDSARPSDAGDGRDAGAADAGENDTPDAGPETDAGEADAGEADAGACVDAGGVDAGPGPHDAGPADAGAPADAGPPPPQPWSFVVMGDNQFATASCTSGVPERLAIPLAVADAAPEFVLHVGDLMDHGYEAGAYERFRTCYSGLLAATPLFPVAGNHDLGSGAAVMFRSFLEATLATTNPAAYGATAWARDFDVAYGDDPNSYSTTPSQPANRPDLPSGFSFKTYYAFRFRGAYFVGLEAGTQWWTNTPVSWLARHLAAARADPSIEHVFVWLHHPLYSSGMPENDPSQDSLRFVRNAYEPTLRAHDVTAVFSGHVHLYDRFYVPDDGRATRTASPPARYDRDADGIHHVTAGGAGGPLPNGCNPMPAARAEASADFQQKRACGYHFVKVTVEGTRLTFETTEVDGSATSYVERAWDRFTIE